MKRLNKENINTPEFFSSKFNGSFGLHDMERLRLLARDFREGIYVDVGCMDSIMPALLAETHKDIYALDFAHGIIEFLQPRFPLVNYQRIDSCYELPFDNDSVSYIVAGELIEHLDYPEKFIAEAIRILKPGGTLAVSTPFEEGVSQGFIGGRQHVWSFNQGDIDKLFGEHNQQLLQESGGVSILIWKRK